jgi:hypothetical protein
LLSNSWSTNQTWVSEAACVGIFCYLIDFYGSCGEDENVLIPVIVSATSPSLRTYSVNLVFVIAIASETCFSVANKTSDCPNALALFYWSCISETTALNMTTSVLSLPICILPV